MSSGAIARGIDSGFFGDGCDGAVTISVDTTMTRAMFFTFLTVESGVTLSAKNYPIYVKNLLVNRGTISCNGNNGQDAGLGAGGKGGAALANETAAGDGGVDGAKASTGVGGGTGTIMTVQNGLGGDAGASGDGGKGGAGAGGGGLAGRSISNQDYRYVSNFSLRGAALLYAGGAGNGGASGAGDGINPGGSGGGGAGAAGHLLLFCRGLDNSGGGLLTAAGGNGGAGYDVSGVGDCGGGGGGGGAGGGRITVIANTIHDIGSLYYEGGIGGAGGGGDHANGDPGLDGSPGTYRIFYVKA